MSDTPRDELATDVALGETAAAATRSVDELGSAASLLRELAHAPGGDRVLSAGDVVDEQYRVERALGAGGMGVVYLARDVRLGRDVALKLGRAMSPDGLARVAREAGTLAQLSHPNVVVVHQVGDHQGRIFFAMEHVAGGTAREWLAAAPRTWRAIVALYCAAGDGLAAAHAAGLVHRDFKPDNVLVGADGRARVADFGLARLAGAGAGAGALDPPSATTIESPAAQSITRTGAVLGTPAYMPPEQLAGADVDARADQFAFCAALWESLFGARPFVGDTPAEVKASIESSEPRTVAGPRALRVPRHVEHALRRGLRPDPADRWPSMTPLLAELRRDPARRRRAAAIAAGAVVAISGAIAVPRVLATSDDADRCTGGAERIASAWNASRAADVRRAFAALHLPWTAGGADAVVTDLDAHAARWIDADRAVCEGAGLTWTDRLRARATSCLAHDRDDLAATANVLATADAPVAANARSIVAGLASPASCTDPAYLAAEVPPPTDARVAAAVAALRPLSSRSTALILAGRPTEARRLSEALLPAAIAIGYEPLIANVHGNLGQALEIVDADADASRELADAYFRARAVHDVRTATLAAAGNVQAKMGLAHTDEADEWSRLAEAEAREAADPDLRFVAESSRLTVARVKKDPHALALADAHLEAARALAVPQRIAYALKQRAAVRRDRGDFDGSIADLEEAIRVVRAAFGDDTSALVTMEWQLAFAQRQTGRYDKAVETAKASRALADRLFGPDSQPSVQPLGVLADALSAGGHDDEAVAIWPTVLRLDVRYHGDLSPEHASDLNNYGLVLTSLHRDDEAAVALSRSVEIYVGLDGPDADTVAAALGNLAETQLDARHFADAVATCDRAYAILAKQPQQDDVSVGYVLTARGGAHLGLHDYAAARADLERALALRDHPDTEPSILALTRLYLAETAFAQHDLAVARTQLDAALPVLRTLDARDNLARAEALAKQLGAAPR